jgi:crotonobetainyl-CoA:carnitine CoA-transferase CaiB-like acyl-CoA transferase
VTGSGTSGPSRVGISICDISAGQAAYAAILEALLLRARTGKGSHLQIALFDTIAEYMNVPYLARRYGGEEPRRLGLAHPSIAPYGIFAARDGEILIAIQNEREWQVFCEKILQQKGLATDPRFDRNVVRINNRQELDEKVQAALGGYGIQELCLLLDEVRIAYGRVSTMHDLAAHAAATTLPVETAKGTVDLLAPPVIVDGARPQLGGVPTLGEHTDALRLEFGGRMSVVGRSPAAAGRTAL